MTALSRWLSELAPVTVLTGAGLSTESGIPDYRGPTGSARKHTPITWQTFSRDEAARQRYWARSYLGWRIMDTARPNVGHHAVTALQQHGVLAGVITQNVDGLHTAAGTTDVIELHGSIGRVRCLGCGELTSRRELDARLGEANAGWTGTLTDVLADGDVALAEDAVQSFRMVTCNCGGLLKPDVVFFGETVPAPRVATCFDTVAHSGGLLVLGSSLTVMSGYRFVLRAAKLGLPVAIVTQGPTRGDGHASLRIDAPLGATLTEVVGDLVGDLATVPA